MYFELATGRIVPEDKIELAYEICTGSKANDDPRHFNDWVNLNCVWNRIFNESEITVRQLIKGNAFADAVMLYRKQHNCTLAEAREVCNQIRMEMEAQCK